MPWHCTLAKGANPFGGTVSSNIQPGRCRRCAAQPPEKGVAAVEARRSARARSGATKAEKHKGQAPAKVPPSSDHQGSVFPHPRWPQLGGTPTLAKSSLRPSICDTKSSLRPSICDTQTQPSGRKLPARGMQPAGVGVMSSQVGSRLRSVLVAKIKFEKFWKISEHF